MSAWFLDSELSTCCKYKQLLCILAVHVQIKGSDTNQNLAQLACNLESYASKKQEIYRHLRILLQNTCLDSKFPGIYTYVLLWNLGLKSGIFVKKSWDSESHTEIQLVSYPLVQIELIFVKISMLKCFQKNIWLLNVIFKSCAVFDT